MQVRYQLRHSPNAPTRIAPLTSRSFIVCHTIASRTAAAGSSASGMALML